MTAFNPSFMKDPRIQRKIQRIRAKGPGYQHLVGSILTKEAGDHMSKMIRLAELGERRTRGLKQLALDEKRLDVMSGLRKEDITSRERISDLTGATRKDIALANIASRQGISEGRIEQDEEALEYKKSQAPWATGLGIANIPLTYALGRKEERERKKLREEIRGSYRTPLPWEYSLPK